LLEDEIGDACRPISLLISIRNHARTAIGSMYDRKSMLVRFPSDREG